MAHAGILSIDQGRCASHFDNLGRPPYLHRDVQHCRLVHQKGNLVVFQGGEPGASDRHGVRRRGNLYKLVHTIVTRFCGSRIPGLGVIERDAGALQHRALGICNRAAQGRRCRLS